LIESAADGDWLGSKTGLNFECSDGGHHGIRTSTKRIMGKSEFRIEAPTIDGPWAGFAWKYASYNAALAMADAGLNSVLKKCGEF